MGRQTCPFRTCWEKKGITAQAGNATHRWRLPRARSTPKSQGESWRANSSAPEGQCSICCYWEPLNCLEKKAFGAQWVADFLINQNENIDHFISFSYFEFSRLKKLHILALTHLKSSLSSKVLPSSGSLLQEKCLSTSPSKLWVKAFFTV